MKTVKDLIVEHFPDYSSFTVGSSDDETKWLKSVLENLKTQIVSNNQSNHNNSTSSSSPINANHLTKNNSTTTNNNINNNNTNNNNCHELVEKNSSNALNGDTNSTLSSSASSAIDNELILIQNAQLKTTVDEYKNIIAETVSKVKLILLISFN